MSAPYYFSPLALVFTLGLAPAADAARPISLEKASLNELKQQFQFPGSHLLGRAVNSPDKLTLLKQHTDKHQVTHARMQQYYEGFLVFGGYAITHSNNQSLTSATKMNGRLYKGLQSELGRPSAHFRSAAASVLTDFKSLYAGHVLSDEQVTPMVYIDEQARAHWAYKVSVLVQYADKIPERPTAFIDALTRKELLRWNDIKTMNTTVKGQGFGGNEKIGEYAFGKEYPLLDITRDDLNEMCFMENTDVKVVDMMHKYSSKNKAMSFACKTDLERNEQVYMTGYSADGYDRENGAASPANDALFAGYVIKHLYTDWYGIEVLTQPQDNPLDKAKPMQLVMRVHYGDAYENAYWDGKQMTFGDGEDAMHPLVSIGVGGHEVSHGFTEQHSGLEYFGQSGGMNEAFSDMAAQAAEYYALGKASWKIGFEIMKKDNVRDSLRYMDQPSRDGRSIDTADDYYGGINVHYSSGVYNHLFYILATTPQWSIRKAFDVMVKANMDYWTPYSNFDEGGCGVLSATKDLGFSLTDVKHALDEVKVSYESCAAK